MHLIGKNHALHRGIVLTLSLVLVGPREVQSSTNKPHRILFIGDSFTGAQGGIYSHLRSLVNADPESGALVSDAIVVGGATLKRLWELGDAVRAIDTDSYDTVVLQDDIPEINVDYFREYARLFVEEARRHHARPVLYMTWAYERLSWISMAQIAEAHRALAEELNVEVAPVGLAWERAKLERPDLDLFDADREHPSLYGMYLATCVLYATVYGKNPSGLRYAPPDVTWPDAEVLQKNAWQTVTNAANTMATPLDDGAIHVRPFVLPESHFLSDETRSLFKEERARKEEEANIPEPCPSDQLADASQMPAIRKCQAEAFYKSRDYQQLRGRYAVEITPARMGGVYTEVFVPVGGIALQNRNRVLINLHGGGFLGGSRTSSHTESIPIASVGKIKVISIDYREGPEYTFPAASEDVAAVYQELLKNYKPSNIGIYGCSAGGLLTAEAVVWLNKVGLPRPGAVGMLCEGAAYWSEGDSGYLDAALRADDLETAHQTQYLKNADLNDPLVFPARSPPVMAKFPPSLLIAATRDIALSSVVYTHSLLVAQGVDAELHVWEGLGHAFFYDPELTESREVYAVVVEFFDKHLGK